MELDKRIIEGKKPLTCFDTEEARKFEGEQGYFSDNPLNFAYGDMALSKTTVLGKLRLNEDNLKYPFLNTTNSINYRFFLPVAWLKPEEPEKKYRPYTLAEWIDQHEIGEVIRFRNTCNQEFNVMYLGYILDTNDDIQDIRTKGQIMFVSTPYTLQELFERYEICINGIWQPFGVIEDD